MPVSIVVGGQFGSEGKGKVALEMVRRDPSIVAAVRVGGTNSGHTGIGADGKRHALRQLPAAAIDRSVQVILPAGSYIDVAILKAEMAHLGLTAEQVAVSPMAHVITDQHRSWEQSAALGPAIGSTLSGTGGAVMAMTARGAANFPLKSILAEEVGELQSLLRDVEKLMRGFLDAGRRVVVEGTQGFGLSLQNGGYWPKATSRNTTAAGFIAETGLSPLDVDDVTMVLRTFPIRVAGDSGPLPGETSWEEIAAQAHLSYVPREFTTVTQNLRRVGHFDPSLVRRAIDANQPTRIVLNHLDYVDPGVSRGSLTANAQSYIRCLEGQIGRHITWVGTGPQTILEMTNASARV
jgi:adenylosuccinate synthase